MIALQDYRFRCYDHRCDHSEWGRNDTLNLMQRGEMAIQSVLLVISIMASVVAQAVTLPTAALAIEAGPLGGKSERTEGMSHRE